MYDKQMLEFWFERLKAHAQAETRISELEVLDHFVFYCQEDKACTTFRDDSLALACHIRVRYSADSWFDGLAQRIEELVTNWVSVSLPPDEDD